MTAATFKRTLERAFSPKIGRGGQGPFEAPAIAGLAPFVAGKAAHVSGIRARGDTLSVTLVEPSGDFLTRISLPYLCPVPSTVPFRPSRRSRAAVVRALLRVIDGRRPCRAAAEPGLRRRAVAAVGTDRLHARRPHAARRGARRSRLARLPADRLRRRLAALAPQRARGSLRAGEPGRTAGRPALLPHDGHVPRLHRPERPTPTFRRREAAAGSQLRARPPRARRGVPRRAGRPDRAADRRRLPVRGVLSRSRGHGSPPPGSSQATGSSTPSSTTAPSSRTATPASTRSRPS